MLFIGDFQPFSARNSSFLYLATSYDGGGFIMTSNATAVAAKGPRKDEEFIPSEKK